MPALPIAGSEQGRNMLDDVIIVGAGSAGASAALGCARRGLSVTCIDARPVEAAGASWINAIPGWTFGRAGLPRPARPVLAGDDVPMYVVAGWGPGRIRVTDADMLEIDMGALVSWIQGLARQAGARFRGGTRVLGWRPDGRGGAWLDTDQGQLRARVIIDASGLGGANLLDRPFPPRDTLCSAAQQVREVDDPQAASRWFEDQGVRGEQVISFMGVFGGYSVLMLRPKLDLDPPLVTLLVGTIPAQGHPSARSVIERFVREHAWVGARRSGGAAPIPLGGPEARLGEGPVALLGDSAGQVFSIHGSGVGAHMMAADLLGRVLARGGAPWDYSVAWNRGQGGLIAAAAIFAGFSRGLSGDDVRTMFERGLMAPGLVRKGMLQTSVDPGLRDMVHILRGALGARRQARAFVPTVGRMTAIRALYRRYPRSPDSLPRWERRREQLLG